MDFNNLFSRLFSSKKETPVEIGTINSLEEEIKKLNDSQIKEESLSLKNKAQNGESLDELLPRAFALAREAAKRTLNQRHFDVQLIGGMVLHHGKIAEMLTGEGKTLAATAPVYLNSLSGKGAHVITVNDYLAKRDTVWMGQVYYFLGMKTACITHDSAFIYDPEWRIPKEGETLIDKERDTTGGFLVQQEFLRPVSRREAYLADITYGTNSEFGFDYLRDNLVQDITGEVQRGHSFAVIDEVDSILIDEARTPLIISVSDRESSEYYRTFAHAVGRLINKEDYTVDEKMRTVEILESGIDKIEKMIGVKNIYAVENSRLVHYLEASLKAKALFQLDKDYVVKDGEIIIVDQFTGRLMQGRRYSAGLHQAIEAKEGVLVKEESRTMAQITIQNYFRLYEKIAGMTGTAQTSAEEFHKVYNLEVESIPPNKPMARKDLPDLVYKNLKGKYDSIVREVKRRHESGQPILIGTVSIEKNQLLGSLLKSEGIPCEVLNAKNHEREGNIIAQAGRLGAVTVATNMAGRGVDIILGGNPPDSSEAQKVRDLGGLHVIGTERHDARRIDNQLRGRAGRQGDPGSSQFFLSAEDDLSRVFGGEAMKKMMNTLNIPDDMPIENSMVSRLIAQAQGRVEGFNFDARKHLLEYDDVLNKQRINLYGKRRKILGSLDKEDLRALLEETVSGYFDKLEKSDISFEDLVKVLKEAGLLKPEDEAGDIDFYKARDIASERIKNYKNLSVVGRQLLAVLDFLWMNHLEDIEALVESVRIRAYGQKDPLVEYRRDGRILFDEMAGNFEAWVFNNVFKMETVAAAAVVPERPKVNVPTEPRYEDSGRNEPCPCGSGKKYKKCHGA